MRPAPRRLERARSTRAPWPSRCDVPGDLTDALAALTVLLDGGVVQDQRSSADAMAFEPARRMPARTRSTIRLRSSSAIAPMMTTMARPSGPPVSMISRNETNSTSEPVELVEHFEEVPGGAGDAIARPDQDHIEPTAAGIPHHLIEPWPPGLDAADPVRVLLNDRIAALSGHLTQVVNLRLRVLIDVETLIYRAARFTGAALLGTPYLAT